MEKTVIVGGREVKMRATALIPRLYRYHFGRDVVGDMQKLRAAYDKVASGAKGENGEDVNFSVLDLTIFENIAWLLCRAADPEIPDNVEDWLDSIDGTFSIYEVMPAIIELWRAGSATTSTPVKK